MTQITREDIETISRYSSLSKEGARRLLVENVYHDAHAWRKFLRLFFVSLGIGFTTAGILFFFAYNWAELHRFVKIGLVVGLIVVLTSSILFSGIRSDIKNIVMTGVSLLVGVLFAVFGQIYQTGANAYDFFLGWTAAITLWVVIVNFPPLWTVYIALINTTLLLYAEQVADWSSVLVFTLLFTGNLVFLLTFLFGSRAVKNISSPIWFSHLLALATVAFGTMGIIDGIFDAYFHPSFLLLILLTLAAYGVGLWYGLEIRSFFYLSVIPFSVIVVVAALLIRATKDFGMMLIIALFIVGSVTLIVKKLIDFQKKWTHESGE